MRYVTKSGFLIVSNGLFIENVGHTLTKNYNGTYWPLIDFSLTDAHPKFVYKLDISKYKTVSNEKDMNNLAN